MFSAHGQPTNQSSSFPNQQVDSFPGLGKEMQDGRDFSPENRPALDDIYGVKAGAAKSAVA